MNRTSIINKYISERGYKSYLEIGIRDGENYNKIICDLKAGVDPAPLMSKNDAFAKNIFITTSDDFFKEVTDKFDCIFIDGDHSCEQVSKDIKNALNHLNDNGVIFLHDTQPNLEKNTVLYKDQNQTGDVNQEYYGTVYQAFVMFVMLNEFNKSNLITYIIPCDGVGVIDTTKVVLDVDDNHKLDKYFNLIQENVNRLSDHIIDKSNDVLATFRIGWPDFDANKNWIYSVRNIVTK